MLNYNKYIHIYVCVYLYLKISIYIYIYNISNILCIHALAFHILSCNYIFFFLWSSSILFQNMVPGSYIHPYAQKIGKISGRHKKIVKICLCLYIFSFEYQFYYLKKKTYEVKIYCEITFEKVDYNIIILLIIYE